MIKYGNCYSMIVILFFLYLFLIPANSETFNDKARSETLTGEAKEELKKYNYKKAYNLLDEAIVIDPSNDEAKDIYVRLNELIKAAERKKRLYEEDKYGGKKTKGSEISEESADEKDESTVSAEVKNAPSSLSLYAGPVYTFGKSSYLHGINSDVQLPGLRIGSAYYTGFSGNRLGFILDYTFNPLIVKGDSRIDFSLHRAYAFLDMKERFYESEGSALLLGVRAGYHFFSLQNKKEEGVYFYTGALSPAVGFFVSDKIFSRFTSINIISRLGIEGGINYMPIYHDDSLLNIYDSSIALTLALNEFGFSLRSRKYYLNNGEINESFSDIELITSFVF